MTTTDLSRRQIAKGVAWTVPAVTLGAPSAFAATSRPCVFTTATWTSTTAPTSASGTGGITATASANSGTTLHSDNLAVRPITNGTPLAGSGWIVLNQSNKNATGQTVTIKLPVTAYCVTFYINDIDTQYTTNTNHYRDQVQVPGFTATANNPAVVTVSGDTATATNTATSSSANTWEWDNTNSAEGMVKFTAPGPLTTFTVTYSNRNPGNPSGINDNTQQVYISPIQYSTGDCAC